MSAPPRIEAAGAEHAAILAELHRACLEDAWPEAAIGTLLGQPGIFASLASDDAPAGFILWRLAADEAEILSLGVLPRARRAGFATSLLDTALMHACALGARAVFLEVAHDNAPALTFYRARGFAEVGRRTRYYRRAGSNAADALVLKLAFPLGITT